MPEGFTVHPKLAKELERRRDALGEEGGIDWAQAEALAFGSLLADGTPVRLTGQDTERGTFSHRHLVLNDYMTGEKYAPIQHLSTARAPFQVHNSPLSEAAALGFEYGYSVEVPRALVLWEAQFGDFVNSAQVIVDQFIVSGLSKWGQSSRLTLLLPHGYEGNGPEHSSARLERFMQLAAQENIRIVNPSTAAQYFHLLRRQALHPKGRPLVVLTPKGLLRLKQATSHLDELSRGSFKAILDDPRLDADQKREVGRLILCSGKVYYDIVGHEAAGEAEGVAVARLEQLYPFPVAAYDELLSRYPVGDRGGVDAGGAAEHGRVARDPPPPRGGPALRRRPPLRRPPVAGQPERGLPDRAPARAGPHRARGPGRLLAPRGERPDSPARS